MFFHVTSKHQPADCPDRAPNWAETLGQLAPPRDDGPRGWADENGVKVHMMAISGPEHTVFMIVEASDSATLSQFLRPIKPISMCHLTPVTDVGFPLAAGS